VTKDEHPPDITETAFDCPYCGAYTTQTWYDLGAEPRTGDDLTPFIYTSDLRERLEQDEHLDRNDKDNLLQNLDRIDSGHLLLQAIAHPIRKSFRYDILNLHLSECYRCDRVAVWVHNRLLFPAAQAGPRPNEDMPAEVRNDYEEARGILNQSPRGAAALLRLAVEKITIHLKTNGKTLDDRISDLVTKGLDVRVQQSLDIVRVIGNEAVHPGTIDLKDDPATANQLLQLVNEIVEEMISKPERVKTLYEGLPENKRKGIEDRDERKK